MCAKPFYTIILFLCLVQFGCVNQSSKLNNYFKQIEHEIDDATFLNKIKTIKEDSLFEVTGRFLKIHNANPLHDSLDSVWYEINRERFIGIDQYAKNEMLIRSFKKYLNNEKIGLDEIKKNAIRSLDSRKKRLIAIEKEYENELKSIIEFNNESSKLGDTLTIDLQLMGSNNYYTIFYSQYPYTLNYSHQDDILKLKGILISKFYDKELSGHVFLEDYNPLNLYFIIKIIHLSNTVSHDFGSKALQVGDTFSLSLESYGRKLGNTFIE